MTREMIINELQNRNYDAKAVETVKNGVTLNGITFKTDTNVSPIIYTDDILSMAEEKGRTLDEVVEEIISLYEQKKNRSCCKKA